MRAIVITRPGGPDVLQLRQLADPEPGEKEIRVRVVATAVNRADLLQRRGQYPAPAGALADVPGLEYSGIVHKVGRRVCRWRVGDRVMGLVPGGGYADFVVVHEREALRVPRNIPIEHAAAIPEAFFTAYDALVTQAALQPRDWVVIHAAASGVGTAASQIASALGARVAGTTRSAWKLSRLHEIGVELPIDASLDFVVPVLEASNGHGADIILDLVGGGYLGWNIQLLARKGRLLIVGLVAGNAAQLDMRAVLSKRLRIIGTAMRSRSLEEKIAVVSAFDRDIMPLLRAGTLRPIIDRVLPMYRVREAHHIVERNGTFGKVVLVWDPV